MSTLDDFFRDGSAQDGPVCSFCGSIEGELVVSVSDAYGSTPWHHKACKDQDDARKGTPLTPMCVCDFPNGSATVAQRERMGGHYNEAGGFCCTHHGNTCGHCHQYD